MSIEAIGAAVAIAGLLISLGVIIARASGRLATVESRVGDLAADVRELRATWLDLSAARARDIELLEADVSLLKAVVRELRAAIVSLSRPRQHIRESDGEILT